MNQAEVLYTLALQLVPGIGSLLGRKLMERLGSAEAVFQCPPARLASTPGIGPALAQALTRHRPLAEAEAELNKAIKHGLEIFFFKDAGFPARLRQCADHPLVLFGKGKLPFNSNRVVAIVGTRAATAYGKQLTEELVRGLLPYNVVVLSGLAYGIDIQAHRAALQQGLPTIAVLGHGLGRLYPAAHRQTAERMLIEGGLLTECWYDTGPDKENFPKRNRIVAGMSDAVVVVEAAENGGALITAHLANEYNRDVFAFPGRVQDPFQAGCHKLIMQNKAGMICNAEDLVKAMNWGAHEQNQHLPRQGLLFLDLEPDEQCLYDFLPSDGWIGMDDLCIQTGFSVSKLSHLLLALEFKAALRQAPGKLYARA